MRAVRVSFSASKHPLLRFVSAPEQASRRQSTQMAFPLSRSPPEFAPSRSAREVGSAIRILADDSVGIPARRLLLFGISRFCRQRVREVPPARYRLVRIPLRDFVAHRHDDHRRKRHRNEGANGSSGSPRGKKCFFIKCCAIDRFNWYPDGHHPVMEPSSFCSLNSC